MVRIKIPMVSSHTLAKHKDIPGPTYRDCQSCHTRPAVGAVRHGTSHAMRFTHLCDRCGPGTEGFQFYTVEEGEDR